VRKIILLLIILGLFPATVPQADMDQSRLFDFDYLVVFKGLDNLPQDAKKLDVWLPLLPNTPYQEVEEVTISPQGLSIITEDKVYNNKLIYFTFDMPVDPSLEIKINYKVRRYEFSNKPGKPSQGNKDDLKQAHLNNCSSQKKHQCIGDDR